MNAARTRKWLSMQAAVIAALAFVILLLVPGCTDAPVPKRISVLHVEFENNASSTVAAHLNVTDPDHRVGIEESLMIGPGELRNWTARRSNPDEPPTTGWLVTLDANSEGHALLSVPGPGNSPFGWGFSTAHCPGPQAWFRLMAQDVPDSAAANWRSTSLAAFFSCDGQQWAPWRQAGPS